MGIMKYNSGTDGLENWIVEESSFNSNFLGKCEAIFCQGNGYLGLRSTLEEEYVGETRNLFVTGTFNQFYENEVTELPNLPDFTKVVLFINKKRFTLEKGKIRDYHRKLNLQTGEVIRKVEWESPDGEIICFTFGRLVSMANDHVIASRIEITPVTGEVELMIVSGIDGTVSNTGAQHLAEGNKRIYENLYLEMISETIQSHISIASYTAHKFTVDGVEIHPEIQPIISRREIKISTQFSLKAGQKVVIDKISTVNTTRDLKYADNTDENILELLKQDSKKEAMDAYSKGYDKLLKDSQKAWKEIWNQQDIKITTENAFDQLAIRFAIYHLSIMVKKDDNRVGIGAKGLSGEGYKGHSFWDTEIFILPYYRMTQPKTARTLLEYRFKNLYGARIKAKENGFEGAMYPWESAWISDGEVTPLWGAADVVTGETSKILTGLIEQHISADIAFAVWQYFITTRDEDFMDNYGYEIILETAKFWNSRLEWKEDLNRFEITDVIGPDEYKEHVDNNAYTNYLAHYNMQLALKLIGQLETEKKNVFERLDTFIGLGQLKNSMEERLPQFYLPQPDAKSSIIPQFDGYMDLKHIDLTKYKECSTVGTIYNDFNMEQINEFQVSKQGDLVVLLYLFDDLFPAETKRKNYFFYEERTLHDSSLSMCTHSVLANDLGLHEEAYKLFAGACTIDLGEEMKSSDAGIHSASMGGIWQSIVFGFGGLRIIGENLRIAPSLPKEWSNLSFKVIWNQSPLQVTVTATEVTVVNSGIDTEIILGDEMTVIHNGEVVTKKIK